MLEAAKSIRLLAMDVDGVLTRGDILYSDGGKEIKVFNIQDGLGISVARCAGLITAIITGRKSAAIERRARELGIEFVFQNCRNKGEAIRQLREKTGLRREEIAYIGDDINDVLAFREAGWKIAVINASRDLKAQADYVTERAGGNGAIREIIELILGQQGKWSVAVHKFISDLGQG